MPTETIGAKYDPATDETKRKAVAVFLRFMNLNKDQWFDRYHKWREIAGFPGLQWVELPDFALQALVVAVEKTMPAAIEEAPPKSTKTKAKARKRSAKGAASTTPAPVQPALDLELGSWE